MKRKSFVLRQDTNSVLLECRATRVRGQLRHNVAVTTWTTVTTGWNRQAVKMRTRKTRARTVHFLHLPSIAKRLHVRQAKIMRQPRSRAAARWHLKRRQPVQMAQFLQKEIDTLHMNIVVAALTTGIDASISQAQQTAQFQPQTQAQQFQATFDDEQSLKSETDQHLAEQERQRRKV